MRGGFGDDETARAAMATRDHAHGEEMEKVPRAIREMERQLAPVALGAARSVAQGSDAGPATGEQGGTTEGAASPQRLEVHTGI